MYQFNNPKVPKRLFNLAYMAKLHAYGNDAPVKLCKTTPYKFME